MGLDHNYYIYSKKEYIYDYNDEGLVVINLKTKAKRLFNRGSVHTAGRNTWWTDHSIEGVYGVDDDIFMIVEVT